MPSEKARQTRQKILVAARILLVQEGSRALSIDRIVRETGLSKGAFLYHFATKKALFSALAADYAAHLEERLTMYLEKHRGAKDPLLSAFSDWYADFDHDDGGWAAVGISLWALHLEDPETLEPIRSWYRKLFSKVSEGAGDSARRLSVIMAFEGFFFLHKMGFDCLSQKDKEASRRYLLGGGLAGGYLLIRSEEPA